MDDEDRDGVVFPPSDRGGAAVEAPPQRQSPLRVIAGRPVIGLERPACPRLSWFVNISPKARPSSSASLSQPGLPSLSQRPAGSPNESRAAEKSCCAAT